ncbi:general odorant-binding protein 56d-like isoform X2 [Neocloeon triangulifer]|uniref:general odorant-binding protein 56d-like isoform X2 n=1 Tax=Neocloeon triangulifer TaxID=2078957 RepID=UPI00286EE956|nr:general odorant-binding protein 56d-like isoform X2 [Neocloeon triangulifer]
MNSLHILFVVVIAAAAVSGYPEPPQSKEATIKILRNTQEVVKKLCAEQTNVKAEDVERLKEGDFEGHVNSTMCYINCYISGLGVMKDGVFLIKEMTEAVMNIMPPELAQRAISAMEMCKEPMGNDNCEKAFELSKCFKTTDAEIAKKLFYPSKDGE